MIDLSIEWEILESVAYTLLLGITALSLCRFERRCRELQKFWNSPTGSALSEQQSDATILGDKLQVLQESIDSLRLTSNEGEGEPRAQSMEPGRAVPFENAVRMAKHGATTEDLTKTCGLNMGEAHLLQRLHAARPNAQEKNQGL